jgi:hypothetical protein
MCGCGVVSCLSSGVIHLLPEGIDGDRRPGMTTEISDYKPLEQEFVYIGFT